MKSIEMLLGVRLECALGAAHSVVVRTFRGHMIYAALVPLQPTSSTRQAAKKRWLR